MTQLQVAAVRINSIEDVRRVLDGPHTSCVPLGSGVPDGNLFHTSIGEVHLRAGRLSADIRTRASIDTNRISFSMKLDPHAALFSFRSGQDVLPGDVYRLARGDVNDYRLTGSLHYAVVSLSADLLRHYVGEHTLLDDVGFWERRLLFRAPAAARALIATSVRTIASQIRRLDGAMLTGAPLRQLQAALVEPFLWGVMLDDRKAHERHALSAVAIVRKVEEWVDGQSPETIQVADLCGALRLSRRTLHRAFAETLGMGPARYLMLKRLAAVRAELRRSDPTVIRVTDTATKYGFWELGRFAKDYRQMFGERPSETLAKTARRGAEPAVAAVVI